MLFIGGLAAIVVLGIEIRRTQQRPEEIYGLILVLFISSILGARVLYCMDFSRKMNWDLRKMLMFWKGGLALHGGAVFSLASFAFYIKWRRLNFWRTSDLLAPSAAIFSFCSRIGCILSGCCYGKQCDPTFPFAITFTDFQASAPKNVSLYPTQLLFAASSLGLFSILWLKRKRKRFDGEIGLMAISIYSLLALAIEFLRGDLRVLYDIGGFSFTQNQLIGAAIFTASSCIYFCRRAREGTKPTALL